MNPWLALIGVALACWSAWLELAARVTGPQALLPIALVLGALSARPLAVRASVQTVPLTPLILLLAAHIVAVLLAPPIFRIAPAALAVCWCLHAAGRARRAWPRSLAQPPTRSRARP